MRLRTTVAITVALALSGCGLQLGKYTVSGSTFDLLEPEFGMIAIDRGTRWGAASPDQNLVCIVALCPGAKIRPPSDSWNSNWMFTSSSGYSWTTEDRKVNFSYSWNRLSDNIDIAGSHFNRFAGNAFVARCDAQGEWRVQQISSVTAVDPHDALRQIQRQLPDDSYIASLSIYL